MTKKPVQTATKTSSPRGQATRQSITFELVARLAPHQGLADNLVRTFGLEPVDYDTIRDATGEHLARTAAFEAINVSRLAGPPNILRRRRVSPARPVGDASIGAMEYVRTAVDHDGTGPRPAGFESKMHVPPLAPLHGSLVSA